MMSKTDIKLAKRSLCRRRKFIGVLCLIGFVLSIYAVHVERAKEKDPSYTALCDISESVSCSTVFTSQYGKGFGVIGKVLGENSYYNQQNGIYGVIMYPTIFLMALVNTTFVSTLFLLAGIAGVIISLYLSFVLFIILEDACVVCITTYIISFILFILSWLNYRTLKEIKAAKHATDYSEILNGQTSKKKV